MGPLQRLKQALELGKQKGMPLTDSSRILNNLAVLQQKLGQSAEAKRLMSEAMTQAEAADYEDKAGYLVTMRFNMARLLEVRVGYWSCIRSSALGV